MNPRCVVVLDRYGAYHAGICTTTALEAAKALVKELGLDDVPGEVFIYTVIHDCDDPGKARFIARGQTALGMFRMES